MRLIDLTTGQQVEPLTAHFHSARNKYICRNWLYVHTAWSKLLEPGHTYALIVTDKEFAKPFVETFELIEEATALLEQQDGCDN